MSKWYATATSLEQQREDAAFGAAWRRCMAAMPLGWVLGALLRRSAESTRWQAVAVPYAAQGTVGLGTPAGSVAHIEGDVCSSPADALNSLALMVTA